MNRKIKSTLIGVMLMLAVCGLVLVIGCGASQEHQKMAQFLMEYGKAVDEFLQADSGHKAEAAKKVDAYKSKWGDMKMELGSGLTPQDLNNLDDEYHAITKKYSDLAGSS